MRLSGRTVLITGGATGIGFETARQLHERGGEVIICGRRAERIDAAIAALPGIRGFVCDLARDTDIDALVAFVRAETPRLDVLINNAAIQAQTDLVEGGDAALAGLWDELRINLAAPIRLTSLLMPMLLARPDAAIVNISSLLAVMPKPSAPGYCASKAGLYAFSRSLRDQLAPTNVEVFVVFPPLVDTEILRGRGRNKMPVDRFVHAMLREIEKGKFEVCVGKARTLWTLNRVAPGLAERLTKRISVARPKPGRAARSS